MHTVRKTTRTFHSHVSSSRLQLGTSSQCNILKYQVDMMNNKYHLKPRKLSTRAFLPKVLWGCR